MKRDYLCNTQMRLRFSLFVRMDSIQRGPNHDGTEPAWLEQMGEKGKESKRGCMSCPTRSNIFASMG